MRRSSIFPILAALSVWIACSPAPAPAAEAPDPAQAVADTQAALAWKLLRGAAPGSDAMVSPASLASAFTVLRLGADPAMQTAIDGALEAPGGAERLLRAREVAGKADATMFVSAGRLVFPPRATPNPLLAAGLKGLGVDEATADTSTAEGVKTINDWVSSHTHGEIQEILGKPTPSAAFVVLDALAFKAKWKEAFDPKLSYEAPFESADGTSAPAKLMRLQAAPREFRADDQFIAVDLPFADPRYSLTVVASHDGKPRALADFAPAAAWLGGAGFTMQRGDLSLPRFSLQGEGDVLPKLGADFAAAAHSPTALYMFGSNTTIDGVLQRTKIDVDEQGATAAAVTAIIVTRGLDSEPALHMEVDKPFLFALRDRQSGLILIAGYVATTPKAKG